MQLSIVFPSPIHCYTYYIEEVKGGHKYTYLHKFNENILSFRSFIINYFDITPVFIIERLPKTLLDQKERVFKEFIDRTR